MRKQKISFKRFVVGAVLCFMIIFEMAVIGGSLYVSGQIKRERQTSYASALDIYNSSFTQHLEQIDSFLLQSVMIEDNARKVIESTTELDRYLAEVRMRSTFDEKLAELTELSGVLWYGKTIKQDVKIVRSKNSDEDASKTAQWIKNHVDHLIAQAAEEKHADWFLGDIQGSPMLVRVLNNRETYVVGWIAPSTLFREFGSTLTADVGDRKLFLRVGDVAVREGSSVAQVAQQGEVQSAKAEQYIFPQNNYRVSLYISLKTGGFYRYMTNPYFVLPVVLASTGILILLVSAALTRYFIRPMDELRLAMRRLQEGELEVFLDRDAFFEEFSLLNQNFADMVRRIKDLKIEVYEEQLEKQNAELQYLKHQINPHFLTNCMNTVRNLLFLERYQDAQKFTTLLGKNIRYDLSDRTMVMLEEELDHVKNYVALSAIRYENQLHLHLEVEEALKAQEIPAMLLQTFVENAVKHEMVPEKALEIWIRVSKKGEGICITVEDDGPGFEEEILEKLQREETVAHDGIVCTGIDNVRRRMRIMYGEKSVLTFLNSGRGARVALWFPLPAEEGAGQSDFPERERREKNG